MDTARYLQRLNYTGPTEPTAETLRQLQLAHLQSVPFENLSIHSSEPIVLNDEALFDKIVGRRRGGFCYELNGLFAGLLRELGFKVVMLSARVANYKGEFGPEFDHMTLLVTSPDAPEERWLADVGFGDSFNEPLLLDLRTAQRQGTMSYRLDAVDDHLLLLQSESDGDWVPEYRFTLEPHQYPDYAEMCHYHQTSPESHFTKAPLCSRLTQDGRITLSGKRFISTRPGVREELDVLDQVEFEKILRDQFGIKLKKQMNAIQK
ncbi:MAG TPA: arylamine N-acetyltransferase [Pyrinomonadaceae bacterium]|nr:arylamine N-acetyltransferase [Pyrinomonadaceae bacterium]